MSALEQKIARLIPLGGALTLTKPLENQNKPTVQRDHENVSHKNHHEDEHDHGFAAERVIEKMSKVL